MRSYLPLQHFVTKCAAESSFLGNRFLCDKSTFM